MTKASIDVVRFELDRGSLELSNVTEEPLRYFRPPFGSYNDALLEELRKRGLSNIMWTYALSDYGKAAVQKKVWSHFEAAMHRFNASGLGLISDQHFGLGPGTSGLLLRMAAYARARGWEFVTLDECLGAAPAPARRSYTDAEKKQLIDAAHPSKWPAPKTYRLGSVALKPEKP